MPGPFPSSQYRTAKKARASASPSKPSASSSSRLDVGGSSSKSTSKTTSSASSSILSSVKSTSKSNAANALRARIALGKAHSKPHSSFKPSSTKPRLNLNSGGVSKTQIREIAENTEKARQAVLQDIAKSKAKEKEQEKDKSAMVVSSTNARRSSTAAGSNPGNARQNATASSSSSSHPAPPQSGPMPVQNGAGFAMYYPPPANVVYPQVPYPQPPPFVFNANTNRRPSAYYNTLTSPVEGPSPTTTTFQSNAPAPAPPSTALVNVDVLHRDLTALYHAHDQLFGRMASVLQAQEAQGGVIQALQGQCTALVESEGEGRKAMQGGFDALLKEVRQERQESRQWRESQAKLFGEFAITQTAMRKVQEEFGKLLGKPKGGRDGRSLFERMEGVEWGVGEIGLILGDPEANAPEGSDSNQRPTHSLVQPEAGPSTVTPSQLNTRDEPIEIDVDEPSASPSTTPPDPAQESPQPSRPQEPEEQLVRSSTSGSAASSSTAPDLHALLGLNTGVPPQSSQSSGAHSPNESAFDFDLEYPPDNSQPGAAASQRRRSKTPEPSPLRVAQDQGAQVENGKETETPMLVEERSKTPEPDPMRTAALAVQKTPTQASILPSSSTTPTLTASTYTATTLSTSTCTRDKSTLHFSRVDWSSTDPNPIPTVSTASPYKPDAETLSKTPIEKRVSATLPPPPPGTVAELRLEVVGCAPYVGPGLTLDRNDQLVVEGPGGQTSDTGASTHAPLVTRPSVSPLPSPATTPSQSREATPVRTRRTESMSTVAVEDEKDGMHVDDVAARGDDVRMQVDGTQRADPTLDILARNLKEVQNLEEERKRIELELEQEKARKDKEEEERKKKEEVDAEAKKRADEAMAEAEREHMEREREEGRLEAEAEAEAKEEAEMEKRDKELAEALRLEIVEAERKEREDKERLARLDEEALARQGEKERMRAAVDKEAFEREDRDRRKAIEQEAKARLDAEAEEQRKREEEEQAVQQEEEAEELLGGGVYNVLRYQEEEPAQDDQQQDEGYDLDLDLEPHSGIDPIYTELGGPTPAQSQQSVDPPLSPELMPASTSALSRVDSVRTLAVASSCEALSVESILSASQEDIGAPDKIDDRVDTSDEGEQDELHEDLDVDQLDSSPTSPIFGSSFNFNNTPHDSTGVQDKLATSSSDGGVEKAATQNRTITYTPKSFMGARSQPLLEIVNNSPQRNRGDVEGEDDGKIGKKANRGSLLETIGPEENEGPRSESGVGEMLPPPPPSAPPGDEQHDDDEAMDETKTAAAVFAVHDPLPNNDMDQDEPTLPESPQEQLFLPGDDDDELSFPPSRPKSSLSQQILTREVSEEVPEATSTPKPKGAPKPVPSATGSISKAAPTSTSTSTQGPPRTPSRNQAYSGMSTPVHLSAGPGLGGRMDSHPASKTLVPTPSRKGALSRRLEEESRNRERSNSVASSVAVGKRNILPLPSTPKVKPTTPVKTSTSTKGKKTPVASAEVIDISSSPEASPNVARTHAQEVISRRAKRLEAKKREKDGDKDVKVKRESMSGKAKGRASTVSDIVIDLTSDKDEDGDAGGSNKAKGKGRQSAKETIEDKDDSGSDSDPPIDGDSDDSAEIVATVPVRRNLTQAARAGSSSSQQPSRLITDRLKNKPGYSAAATRLKSLPMKRRKDGDSDGDDRPMKRAREGKASRGSFVPTIGTVKTRPVAAPIASGSSKASDKGKRKERDDDDDGVVVKKERTLKAMGRDARGSSTTSTVASSSKSRESGNAKTLRQRTVDLEAEPVKWPPANKHGNRKFQRDFIECDMCNGWYHYGCVGIKEDDPRIRSQDPESFMCPRCEMGLDPPHRTKEERERCGRPTCIQRAPRPNEYYVERLVGRKYSGMGASYSWLVKWDGYPLEQSTWQTEKDMAEPMKLIESFTEAAEKEGKDLGNPYKKILLSEVEKSGWIDPDR